MDAISLNNVSKAYKSFTLDDITLKLPKGCVMGLLGENGAGKTTLLNIILGNVFVDSGFVSLLGENRVRKFSEIRQKIGVVPDDIGLPDGFKVKHIRDIMSKIFNEWDNEMFDSFVERFKIPDKTRFKDYSLGMKKKLGIAIALSHNAELLILDEATSGLDPIVRDDFLDIIYDFTRDENHSVLFSSHIVSDLERLSDYIAIMHKGKLLLCEEKDLLLDKYCLIKCSEVEMQTIPAEAVIGKKISPYGVQAVVERSALRSGFDSSTVTLEDLFVYMLKEGI
ncbi:MAG: ABC transporter ATP-binding protein [Lachnospiraceae bacterium]|nr:ABC transporter ATP-binding protein [Lachnospiraceae bacterium]